MKIRSGFVSNSSSSSFLIDVRKYNIEDIKCYIEKLLDAENFIRKSDISIDDICTVEYINSVEYIFDKAFKYKHNSYLGKDHQRYIKRNSENYPKGAVIINSIDDNSIPWNIQDSLHNIGERFHWG